MRVELLVRFEVHHKSDGKAEEPMTTPPHRFLRPSRRAWRSSRRRLPLARSRGWHGWPAVAAGPADKEVLPKHVTPETIRAVIKGLDYLAAQQAEDGSWITGGGQAYPVAMTGLAGTALLAHGDSPTRGKYSKTVQGAVEFLVRCATPTGLITGPNQDSGHAHARAWLRAPVPGVGLRHDHQGVAAQAGAGRDPQGGHAHQPGPECGRGAGPTPPAPATKGR